VLIVGGQYRGAYGVVIKIKDSNTSIVKLTDFDKEVTVQNSSLLRQTLQFKTLIKPANLKPKSQQPYTMFDLILYQDGERVGLVLSIMDDQVKVLNQDNAVVILKSVQITKKLMRKKTVKCLDF